MLHTARSIAKFLYFTTDLTFASKFPATCHRQPHCFIHPKCVLLATISSDSGLVSVPSAVQQRRNRYFWRNYEKLFPKKLKATVSLSFLIYGIDLWINDIAFFRKNLLEVLTGSDKKVVKGDVCYFLRNSYGSRFLYNLLHTSFGKLIL